ncbi:MAG TPA: methyltransferase domain-containing protein, partial [Solirubrobacterales bacterium]|nr:methyltransferase domain-containing protein [Solirubrobacterales bacterium]
MADQTSPVAPREAAAATPEYGSYYYRHDCGIPYERNEHWLGFFDKVAETIVREFHPTRVLDAGCAMGFLVEALRKRGIEASGIDVSEYAISQVHESVAEHCRVASLTEPLAGRYDLVTCIEVLEHIPPEQADAAIANLCAASDQLLISSSPTDFAEPTHLNVQPPEFWSAALAREGFYREVDRDLSYLTPWA